MVFITKQKGSVVYGILMKNVHYVMQVLSFAYLPMKEWHA